VQSGGVRIGTLQFFDNLYNERWKCFEIIELLSVGKTLIHQPKGWFKPPNLTANQLLGSTPYITIQSSCIPKTGIEP